MMNYKLRSKDGLWLWQVSVGKNVCQNFKVEERLPGQFVIFCDGPFTYKIAA